ncbi:MAG: hypothetical protein HY738_05600 [Bacteroidia bacterium]|nr:hypothetical protein [Bacteroidia bacterium]
MTRQLQTDTQADSRKRKFSFFANALLKDKKEKDNPTLNFLSGFLSSASFSTFASRAFLFVGKFTNKNRTPFGRLAKELNPSRKTKTPAQKFSLPALALWTTCLIALPTNIFAQQKTNDTNDISVNATNYLFAYNMKLKYGSYSIGPTISLNTNGKLTLQFGLLYDFKKYIYYEKRIDYSTGSFYYESVEHINLFVPLFLHYNYFNSDKISSYLTAGFLLGGQNTIDENNKAVKTSNINFICGAGISYRPLKRLALRIYPTIRYNTGYFFPGISMDISFLFNSKKLLL